MSAPTPAVSKGRLWLNSFLTALAVGVGYLVVSLMSQQSPLTTVIGLAAMTLLLTPIFYWVNARRAKSGTPPRR